MILISSNCWNCQRTRIAAPHLVELELINNYGLTLFLGKMPLLVQAFVRLIGYGDVCGKEKFGGSCYNYSCNNCGESGDGSGECVLLKGLSQAENLELVAEPRQVCWCLLASILLLLVAYSHFTIYIILWHTHSDL